ncbi:inosamine-phosphate amidinotransferase 1 [Kutzneria sp. NPDC052558]|uniref:inosamine-phosphate amidinotransferase 1 n=1 Tax=Kutzneria sp. NPDC052558 TaxID=3364121 RepID=UPI0037CA1FF7
MSLVDVHNEWDPLEEVIIGSIEGARAPISEENPFTVDFSAEDGTAGKIPPPGPLAQRVVDETRDDLEALSATLVDLGVTVRRPEYVDYSAVISTPDWHTTGFYGYCPRDVLLAIGDTVIETPMVQRSRFLEPYAYKDLLLEYFDSGARWLSAPKPRLADAMFDWTAEPGKRLGEYEPVFDAANVLRFGTDILYLVSDSGNQRGAQWLQMVLGDRYTVHAAHDLYASTHVDSTVAPLRPGLVLLNPARVKEDNLPEFLRGWDKVWCPEPVDTGYVGDFAYCSPWIGMNLLVVRPGVAIVDDRQVDLIGALERRGVEVLSQRLTHSRTLGGSFHCASLDVRRTGTLETYR